VSASWHLVTGEYPPQAGGVSDYTAALAQALTSSGCDVHVWAPPAGPDSATAPFVHRLPDRFQRKGLRALDAGLDACAAPRIVLVQYVPQAFGMRGLNVGFCRWVDRRARTRADDVRVMFHEPYYPFSAWPPQHNVLALVNRIMASQLLRAARTAYVSTTAWTTRLRRYAPAALPFVWLPVPSSIARVDDRARVAAMRQRFRDNGAARVVGHFGTYGSAVLALLSPAIADLLGRRSDVRLCLLGHRSDAAAAQLTTQTPANAGRVIGLGRQEPADISAGLQACDVVLQPYADGASGRRTTLMAALANGVAVVTNAGAATERVWADEGAVSLVRDASGAALAGAIVRLLEDDQECARLAARGRSMYERHFAIERSVETLLNTSGTAP